MALKNRILLLLLVFSGLLSGCFTGVENTGRISYKDVQKVHADKKSPEETYMDTVVAPDFMSWRPGKAFVVNDDNIRLVLRPTLAYDMDTIHLKGDTLRYVGYKFNRQIDNKESVVLLLEHGNKRFSCDTGKTIGEVENTRPEYIVPFVTDLDFVSKVDSMLRGKTLYVKTSFWADEHREATTGVQYVPVRVVQVVPGDVVYPFFVWFDYGERRAGVFMSSSSSAVKNMTFDKLFSFSDIRLNYPAITDENWDNIVHGRVALNMTKNECALALGNARTVDRMPTYGGIYERWTYENGVYLIFENGLLVKFRQ